MSGGLNASEFLSEYLSGKMLNGEILVGEITGVVAEEVASPSGKKARKLVIKTSAHAKPIVLNKTSLKSFLPVFGEDASKWLGRTVEISSYDGQAFGELTKILLVRPAEGIKTAV